MDLFWKINITLWNWVYITSPATSAVLNAVGNKISNVSDLVKKTDYDNKDIDATYFNLSNYNKFMVEIPFKKVNEKG